MSDYGRKSHGTCYTINTYYACTEDNEISTIYYGMRKLEQYGTDFPIYIRNIDRIFRNWIKDNRLEGLKNSEKIYEIFGKAIDFTYQNPTIPDTYEEREKLYAAQYYSIITAVPYLIEADKEADRILTSREKDPHYKLVRELWNIKEDMDFFKDIPYKTWKNSETLREAFKIIKKLPDYAVGCFSNAAEKAIYLNELLEWTTWYDVAGLAVDIRTYIDKIFKSADSETIKENEDFINENSKKLAKCRDYIDLNIPMEEYCMKYGIEVKFDPVERTEKWEKVIFDVDEEVYDNLGNPVRYGDNYYSMHILERKKVLKKYGIDWKDPVEMNPDKKMRYFGFSIDGVEVATDSMNLYMVYAAINALECQDEDFARALDVMNEYIVLWLEELKTKELKERDEQKVQDFIRTFEMAKKAYISDNEDVDTPLQMVLDRVVEIHNFEHWHRFGYIQSSGRTSIEDEKSGRLRKSTFDLFDRIQQIHSKIEGNHVNVCNDKEQKVLDNLKTLIEEYHHDDLYLTRSILMACNNWTTFHVVRESSLMIDIQHGVDHYGSLGTDRAVDWQFMSEVVAANPRLTFMEDDDRLYGIVCDAMESDDPLVEMFAEEVRDLLWEPEKTIEED